MEIKTLTPVQQSELIRILEEEAKADFKLAEGCEFGSFWQDYYLGKRQMALDILTVVRTLPVQEKPVTIFLGAPDRD